MPSECASWSLPTQPVAVSYFGRFDPYADGEMGFPSAGRAEQIRVGSALVVEVELLDGFMSGKPCGFDPQRRAGRFAFGNLAGEHRG